MLVHQPAIPLFLCIYYNTPKFSKHHHERIGTNYIIVLLYVFPTIVNHKSVGDYDFAKDYLQNKKNKC